MIDIQVPQLKIGLLGGSFNPPHSGHLYISLQSIKRLQLDQVWWLFCRANPLKHIQYESFEIRSSKARDLIGLNRRIKLINTDDIYTYKTLRHLKRRYPMYEFTWIMGLDSCLTFHLWELWTEILHSTKFAIFDRDNNFHHFIRSKFASNIKIPGIRLLHIRKMNISSTEIRNAK